MMVDDIFLIFKLVTFSISVLVHPLLLPLFLHNQYLTLRVHVRLAMPWNDLIGHCRHMEHVTIRLNMSCELSCRDQNFHTS